MAGGWGAAKCDWKKGIDEPRESSHSAGAQSSRSVLRRRSSEMAAPRPSGAASGRDVRGQGRACPVRGSGEGGVPTASSSQNSWCTQLTLGC